MTNSFEEVKKKHHNVAIVSIYSLAVKPVEVEVMITQTIK